MELYKKIQDFYYSVYYGIANLFRWHKTIYADRDWDYEFLINLIIKKLEFKIRNFELYAHRENSQEQIDEMNYVLGLLNKYLHFDYHEEGMTRHDLKWGGSNIVWVDVDFNKNLKKMQTVYNRDLTEEETTQEKNEFRQVISEADARRAADLEEAFTYIGKHIEGWWD